MFCPKTRMNTHFFVTTKFVCYLLLQTTEILLQLYANVAQVCMRQLNLKMQKRPRCWNTESV